MTDETNEQLVARYRHCRSNYQRQRIEYERMTLGPARTKKAKWLGCLGFNLLQLQEEMDLRGIGYETANI